MSRARGASDVALPHPHRTVPPVEAPASAAAISDAGEAGETSSKPPVVPDEIRLRIEARRLPTTTALHGKQLLEAARQRLLRDRHDLIRVDNDRHRRVRALPLGLEIHEGIL